MGLGSMHWDFSFAWASRVLFQKETEKNRNTAMENYRRTLGGLSMHAAKSHIFGVPMYAKYPLVITLAMEYTQDLSI
jgi:hypothetical protein